MEPKGLPMTQETRTRAGIAILIYSMANGVLFGAGLILVLSLPALSADIGFWISVIVAASFILAAPIAWWMAPRLRARYWRQRVTAPAMMSEPL
jgi:thiosulfate reductase cytochrome b subunit